MAQTGSMVREDRVWNYMHVYGSEDGTRADTVPDYGYHFEGSRERGGKTYMSFRNGAGEEVALMRQEGARVYVYADDPYTDKPGEDMGDVLLYDLDPRPGVEYPMYIGYGLGMADVELVEAYRIAVGDTEYDCDRIGYAGTLQCQMVVADGVGPQFGTLNDPFMRWTTGYDDPLVLHSLTDRDGKILFENSDFRKDRVSIMPDGWVWEYVHSSAEGDTTRMMAFSMRMSGGCLEPQMQMYRWSYTTDPLTGTLEYNGDMTVGDDDRKLLGGYSYSFRGFYGQLYIKVPRGLGMEGVNIALLCDYDADKGAHYRAFTLEQPFCGEPADGLFSEVSVTATGTEQLAGHDVRTLTVSGEVTDRLWIEGIGNTATGIIPFAATAGEGTPEGFNGYRLNRVTDGKGEEVYRSVDYIDLDNLGNKNSIESVACVLSQGPCFNGSTVSAPGYPVTIYDMAGHKVVEGHGSVSTAELLPGVYFATAGGKTLKILVR